MKICDKCGKGIQVWQKIDGKLHNFNNRRYCLECSPLGKHNTRPIPEVAPTKESKVCSMCGRDKAIGEYYKKGQYLYSECRDCFNKRSTEQQRKRKSQAIEYKGGKCLRCGFVGHTAVFDFHHVDPKKKKFGISDFKNRTFKHLKEELDKCVLLCANCHRELTALGSEADWSFLE